MLPQAFRVVAEGSYLLAHGLTFDNLVMQVSQSVSPRIVAWKEGQACG